MTTRSSCAAALLLAAMACVPDEGPLMAANEDCLGCHGRGEGPDWTVAGTFGGKGSHVTISDASRSFTVRTAENGNFYTAEKVSFPFTVSVDGKPMVDGSGTPMPITYGGCNLCHGPGGVLLGLDEFMAPGVDCLGCHDGRRASPAFTAAGTWSGPGLTVTVSGARPMTTNRVGNFFTADPVTLPGTARVGGETMDDLEYGGCNRCHPFGRDAEGD